MSKFANYTRHIYISIYVIHHNEYANIFNESIYTINYQP